MAGMRTEMRTRRRTRRIIGVWRRTRGSSRRVGKADLHGSRRSGDGRTENAHQEIIDGLTGRIGRCRWRWRLLGLLLSILRLGNGRG